MVSKAFSSAYTGFDGHRQIASGSLQEVALVIKQAIEGGVVGPVLLFDDSNGSMLDIDVRGSDEEVVARLAQPELEPAQEPSDSSASIDKPRDRGRPKLGVIPREVTLLPRHWEWLATQPGGASVTLRKLVEEARRTNEAKDNIRKAQERAYRFMSAMAGNMPDFEEATRALFANNQARFIECVAEWPEDISRYATALAFGTGENTTS